MQECKDAEPDVLFVGDSMVQLMQQYEVIAMLLMSRSTKGESCAHNITLVPFVLEENKLFHKNPY